MEADALMEPLLPRCRDDSTGDGGVGNHDGIPAAASSLISSSAINLAAGVGNHDGIPAAAPSLSSSAINLAAAAIDAATKTSRASPSPPPIAPSLLGGANLSSHNIKGSASTTTGVAPPPTSSYRGSGVFLAADVIDTAAGSSSSPMEPLLLRRRDDSTGDGGVGNHDGISAAASSLSSNAVNLAATVVVAATKTTSSPPSIPSSPLRRADFTTFASGSYHDINGSASTTTGVAPPHASPYSGSNVFLAADIIDTAAGSSSPMQDTSPVSAGVYATRCRQSPRSTEMSELGVFSGSGSRGAAALATSEASGASATTGRTRFGFRVLPKVKRGNTASRRKLRRTSKLATNQDSWSRESFLYMSVFMLLTGTIAFLSTMMESWFLLARFMFVTVFGITAGFACTGAMALLSKTPSDYTHFSSLASRLTFIVGCLAFEAAVFYLLGLVGFLAWLVTAAVTTYGMSYFWKSGHPESLDLLVSGLRRAATWPRSLFACMMGFLRRA